MTPGIWHVLEISEIGRVLDTCGLVITGEGRADSQTLHGKVPAGVLEYVRRYDYECGGTRHTKVVLLAGQVSDRQELLDAGFDEVLQSTPQGMPLEEALDPQTAARNITSALSVFSE